MTIYCKPEAQVIVNSAIFNFGTKDQSQVTSRLVINGSIVDSKQIDFLESGRSETVHFYWTPHVEGIYNVTSYVLPVAGENITENNALSINVRVRIPKVIEVERNNRIQDAIDVAYPGDTVRVAAGTYYEHVTIEKSLILIGGKGGSTVIDGNGAGIVMHILADNVNVSGFTIQNGDCDICLNHCDRNTITSNKILNNLEGLILFHSGNNIIKNNSMVDNEYNFEIIGDFSKYLPSHFIQDMDASNTVDGKPVYYWVNQHNKQVPVDAGYVAVVGSTNITVKNLNLTKNSQGVLLAYTDGSVVENINASQNRQGILLAGSSNNTIRANTVLNNILA